MDSEQLWNDASLISLRLREPNAVRPYRSPLFPLPQLLGASEPLRLPGLTQRRFLHAHHIEHRAHRRRTELSNLVHLCRSHHPLVHEGGYTLERLGKKERRLRFRRPDGRAAPDVWPHRPLRGHPLERRNRAVRRRVLPDPRR